LAITFDCWTSNAQHPYIEITVHYIDNDWILQTYCLTCTSLDVDHTSYNIRDIIESTLVGWGIQISNISGANTDNGTNVIKAVDLLGINGISCFGHTLNNGVMSSMSLSPVQILLSKISKLRFKFHFSSKLRRLLKEAQQKHNLPQIVMPASCVTRWWTSLPALQFIRDQHEALFDVLYKLKSSSIKYLSNCNEQKLIRVIRNLYEPLKTLGEHMSSEQVVTASSIWPIYLKLKESIHQNNNNPKYTCDLTQSEDQDNYGDTEELFPTASQCALSTGEITSYLSNNEVDETNNSDEETCGNVINDTSSDTMLNHLEDYIKRAIKTPLFKRYDSVQARPILLKISFLDPRYRSHYIELSQKDLIIRLIKQEMDDIGHQVEVDKHDENKNIGG